MNEHNGGEHMQPDEGAMSQPVLPAGEQLAAARQARGWSIEDVAAQLNLAPRQVLAIETGNHAALPGMPITRGFIRAYAKLLKIDAAPLLATLGAESAAPAEAAAPRKLVSAPFAESRMPTLGERKRSSFPLVAIVGALVLVAAGYWALQNRDLLDQFPGIVSNPSPSQQTSTPAAPTLAEPTLTEPTTSAADTAAPANTDPTVSAPTDPAAAPSHPAPVTASGSTLVQEPAVSIPTLPEASGSVTSSRAATASESSSTPVAAADGLRLSAREETWVEIRRAGGNDVVLSRLMKPGESQTIGVTEPLSVVIGNASGVELTLRGAPVPVKGGAGNVSKITVK